MTSHADVVICGGGLVGGALALALQDSGLCVALLEAQQDFTGQDARTLAISYASRLVLERLGVWEERVVASPIERIHVSHRGQLGQTVLTAAEMGVPALGYVVRHAALGRILHDALQQAPVHYQTGARVERVATTRQYGWVTFERQGKTAEMTSRLLVLADGGQLARQIPAIQRRVHAYGQVALVGEVATDTPPGTTAYERFTPDGPVALLPAGDRYALIWTLSPAQAEMLGALSDDLFLDRLQTHFGGRAGAFTSVTGRASFPLTLQVADSPVAPRCVLIGNAAQTLHPVAGQGFNLGLRDAWKLGRHLRDTPPEAMGGAQMLDRYQRARRYDRWGGVFVTDSLIRLFSNPNPLLALGRSLGFGLLESVPPARRLFARSMIYGLEGL